MKKYIAYNFGKMNQSFVVKDEHNEPVYEANLLKFSFFGASSFEFENKLNGSKEQHKVGKTKTTEQGTGSLNFASASYFNLDKKNVFSILDEKGYFFKLHKLNLIHPEFALVNKATNETLAIYRMNVQGPRQENVKGIGNKQNNTEIETESSDLYVLFLGGFILNRVDFSTYLV